VQPRPEVDVVGTQHYPCELRVGVRVLNGSPPTDQDSGAAVRGRQPGTCDAEGLRPGRRPELAVVVANKRGGNAVTNRRVGERPAALVAVPLLVHLRVVTGQAAQHFSAPVVGALSASRCAVLTGAGAGHQVERAGAEPICSAGERADRADLHRVAGEVRLERLASGDANLLQRTAFQQLDEQVAGDLVRNRVQRAHSTQRSGQAAPPTRC
jgi:hypothetical protein